MFTSAAPAALPTQNEGWGFWGAIWAAFESKPETAYAWGYASQHLAYCTGADADAVRAFLDSRHGRHFADTVLNKYSVTGGAHSIDQAVNMAASEWKGYPVRRASSSRIERAIPRGVDYLKGFVLLAGIESQA